MFFIIVLLLVLVLLLLLLVLVVVVVVVVVVVAIGLPSACHRFAIGLPSVYSASHIRYLPQWLLHCTLLHA